MSQTLFGVKCVQATDWILDADVAKLFDELDRDRAIELLDRQVGDGRLLRLIRKSPNAGVTEEDR